MTEGRGRILVCDDEPHLREMVGEYLAERGYDILQASDAEKLHQLMENDVADLIILDVNMPGQDGLSALRSLRDKSDIPVIMLTAAAEVIDRVVGLEFGADDYLGKPVDLRELEARIKAALRRRPGNSSSNPNELNAANLSAGTVQFGQCKLDIERAKLFDADDREIPLTAMEFSLLRVFAQNKGRPLNRDQLLEHAHSRSWAPFDRSIDLRISRLRRKLEINPTKPKVIKTVRGIGYVFD